MELEKLKSVYAENKVVRAICDLLAARERNQNETKLHVVVRRLTNNDPDLKKSEIIAAFRALEDAGCGRYVEGRRGWRSRFVWEVKSLDVSAAAKGEQALERDASPNDAVDPPDEDAELIEHSFALRPDLSVSIELPADLTKNEASRLAAFLQALPFEDES